MVVNAWARGRLTQDWQPLPNAFGSLYVIGFMYSFFFVIELIGAAIAFKLDREDGKLLVWLFWQRFLYRQLMYAVLLRSIKTAVFRHARRLGQTGAQGHRGAGLRRPVQCWRDNRSDYAGGSSGVHRPVPYRASTASRSFSAWKWPMSGSMMASRLPFITSGRLWTVRPMRWSVTRSCGKL